MTRRFGVGLLTLLVLGAVVVFLVRRVRGSNEGRPRRRDDDDDDDMPDEDVWSAIDQSK